MDDESLQSILSNDAAPAVTPEVVEAKAEPEAVKPAQVRDEGGKFAKAEPEVAKPTEAKAEPVKVEAAKPTPADVAAIIDERRKRQALEAELQQLKQQQQPTTKPSVFEDEDAAIASRVQEHVAPLRGALLEQSVEIARYRHGADKFAEAEAAFFEAVQQNPDLAARFRNASNPGEFVFSEGTRTKELAEVGGDFLKYREKLTAGHSAALAEKETRITALQAELEALKKTNADLQSLPRSLNKSPSGTPQAGEEDDDDLASIVRFNNRKSGS